MEKDYDFISEDTPRGAELTKKGERLCWILFGSASVRQSKTAISGKLSIPRNELKLTTKNTDLTKEGERLCWTLFGIVSLKYSETAMSTNISMPCRR